MDTLRIPYVDLDPLTIDRELFPLIILQLNLSMWKHFSDKEWSRPLGFKFSWKQA